MRIFLFILATTITTAVLAQQTGTDSISHNLAYTADAEIQVHELKNYTSVFIDSTNKLTIQEIASQKFSNRFQPLPDSMQAQPYITYWLKFSISASGDIQNWWLLLGHHGYVDAWFLNNSGQVMEHQRTGRFIPRSQKRIKEDPALNRLLFSLKTGETKNIYLKIYNEYAPVHISSPQLRNPVIGLPGRGNITLLIIGSVLVFSILSFFFFFFVKEKAYLFFGIYTLLVSLNYLMLHPDIPFVDWFIPEHPHLAVLAFYLVSVSGWISFILFGRFFINLPQLSKRLDTILKWGIALWVILLLIEAVMVVITHRVALREVTVIFLVLFFIFLIRIAFFKSILVRIYVAGALWLFCSILSGMFFDLNYMFPIGQLGQLLIYAAGLAYKVRLNAKARAEADIATLRNVELASLYEESKKQKEEIEVQKKNAENAVEELKAAQSQLIQSEKMASLGELTAGIAHEIQNPLNFINNFSEVSAELADEIKEALNNNDKNDAIEKANDIKENLEKITHHGKRADAIVKGMLQHSRASSGKKEPTDINALADEYLRLSYHGLRAKDKTFNATLETDFDQEVGKINIISHDVGRVILNLFTNAFYSVTEKKKILQDGYMPTVSVSTKKINDWVEIRIKDNGIGIPQKVLDKIYQPFFTTKPTGKGTGLGLSLSYDIINAHNGQLTVETKEGEFAEFIINLPTTD